ncbi:MAG TPA: DUF4345 domain-containing protein [Myxococcota bacterium]|nr:DUF4345 domain-containing protein [Myxococcota bacterium]
MRFARIFLLVMGWMGLFFGAIYLLWPQSMTDPTGFPALGPNALTDVRATYGGLQIGTGLFLLWAVRDASRVRTALVLQALLIGAVAASRAFGIAVDGTPNGVLVGALVTELCLTLLALVALGRTRSSPSPA